MTNSDHHDSLFTPKHPSSQSEPTFGNLDEVQASLESETDSTLETELSDAGLPPIATNDSTNVQEYKNEILNFRYTGEGGSLFGLYFKNIFLSILTLGIYSFWGKVEIQKYLYNATSLMGRNFSFHATGKEKFVGFLIGGAVVGVFFTILNILPAIFGPKVGGILYAVIMVVAVLFASPWLTIASRKFLLSRSSWSNVRFRFTGDYKELVWISVKGMVLSAVTLGIYLPWYLIQVKTYITQNSWIGNKQFSYDGEGKEFFMIYLKGILLSIVTLGIYGPFFIANIIRYHAGKTQLGSSRFSSSFSGGDMWLIYIAMVFSMGIFTPFAMNMGLRIFFEKLTLFAVASDLQYIENIEDEGASAFADGVASAGDVADAIGGMF